MDQATCKLHEITDYNVENAEAQKIPVPEPATACTTEPEEEQFKQREKYPHVWWVPTRPSTVIEMLSLSCAGPHDTVIDLGCGDGRILIAAVKQFNVKAAVGYDYDLQKVKLSRQHIEEEGLQDRITVIHKNIFEADISQASIITMYLLDSVCAALGPKLAKELQPGTRVVSYCFPLPWWSLIKKSEREAVLLYTIPESLPSSVHPGIPSITYTSYDLS